MVGKPLAKVFYTRYIQEHVRIAVQGHLPVDSPGHHVPGGKVAPLWGVFLHKPAAIRRKESPALSPDSFGNQEVLSFGNSQGGGVELNVFSVDHPGAGAVGHGEAVPPGTRGVRGVPVDPTEAPGGEDRGPGDVPPDLTPLLIQYIRPMAGYGLVYGEGIAGMVGKGDQVHRGGPGDELHVGKLPQKGV